MQQTGRLEEVTRLRKPEGRIVRGRLVVDQTQIDEEVVLASVQRLSRISVGRRGSNKLLKELWGDRTTEMIKLYAPIDTFREADDNIRQLADLMTWEGKTYQVSVVNHWKSLQALDHDEVYAMRVDNDIDRHSARI